MFETGGGAGPRPPGLGGIRVALVVAAFSAAVTAAPAQAATIIPKLEVFGGSTW
jgi:hypothetical protein